MQCMLSELRPGSTGSITALTLHGPMRRRLQDLGFLPGAKVTVRLRGWGGGISAYQILDSLIALRSGDAARILVDI